MPAPPKPPSQRHGHRNGEAKRASSTALPAQSRRKPPPPPTWLARKFHAEYRTLWRSSVANLWAPDAARLVARLVVLDERVRRLGDDVTAAQLSALLQLERELLLGTRSARASGVTVRDEAPVEDDETKPTKRRRSTVDQAGRERVDAPRRSGRAWRRPAIRPLTAPHASGN